MREGERERARVSLRGEVDRGTAAEIGKQILLSGVSLSLSHSLSSFFFPSVLGLPCTSTGFSLSTQEQQQLKSDWTLATHTRVSPVCDVLASLATTAQHARERRQQQQQPTSDQTREQEAGGNTRAGMLLSLSLIPREGQEAQAREGERDARREAEADARPRDCSQGS